MDVKRKCPSIINENRKKNFQYTVQVFFSIFSSISSTQIIPSLRIQFLRKVRYSHPNYFYSKPFGVIDSQAIMQDSGDSHLVSQRGFHSRNMTLSGRLMTVDHNNKNSHLWSPRPISFAVIDKSDGLSSI